MQEKYHEQTDRFKSKIKDNSDLNDQSKMIKNRLQENNDQKNQLDNIKNTHDEDKLRALAKNLSKVNHMLW